MSDEAGLIPLKLYSLIGRIGDEECYVTVTTARESHAYDEIRKSVEDNARRVMVHKYPGVTILDGEWSDYEMPREDAE